MVWFLFPVYTVLFKLPKALLQAPKKSINHHGAETGIGIGLLHSSVFMSISGTNDPPEKRKSLKTHLQPV